MSLAFLIDIIKNVEFLTFFVARQLSKYGSIEVSRRCLRIAMIRSVIGLVSLPVSVHFLFVWSRTLFSLLAHLWSYKQLWWCVEVFPLSRGLCTQQRFSLTSRPTFMLDCRKSCTSFHVFSLSCSFTSMTLKLCFLEYCWLWLTSLIASFAVYSVSCWASFSSRTSFLLLTYSSVRVSAFCSIFLVVVFFQINTSLYCYFICSLSLMLFFFCSMNFVNIEINRDSMIFFSPLYL